MYIEKLTLVVFPICMITTFLQATLPGTHRWPRLVTHVYHHPVLNLEIAITEIIESGTTSLMESDYLM